MKLKYYPDADGGFIGTEDGQVQVCDFRKGMGEKYGEQMASVLGSRLETKEDLVDALLNIAARSGAHVSSKIIASYASQLTDKGRDQMIQDIGEAYCPTRFQGFTGYSEKSPESPLRYPVQIISHPTSRKEGNSTILGFIYWFTYNDGTSERKEFDRVRISWPKFAESDDSWWGKLRSFWAGMFIKNNG